jgi:hypothetical protein
MRLFVEFAINSLKSKSICFFTKTYTFLKKQLYLFFQKLLRNNTFISMDFD